MIAKDGEGAGRGRLTGGDMEEQAGNQCLGLLVPMRLARFAGGVIDQRVSERHCIVGEIETGRVDTIERIERGRGLSRHPERIEDMDRAEPAPLTGGDTGVFALGVDADHGAGIVDQVRNYRADALPVRVGAIVSRWAGPA